ncbi:undecaprenyl-phosphate galactose phosphotransferase WbaP [Granulosicoccus sp. 3-233]|uniref:undecaprenyl-phosphate galactose phosphotransferase WbaP n=1 Tax=Granulosicoccus sp. 3-233 TaxID=3417969 RepID=UPI003D350D96
MSKSGMVLEKRRASEQKKRSAPVVELTEHRRDNSLFSRSVTLIQNKDHFAKSTFVRSGVLVCTDIIATMVALSLAYFLVPAIRVFIGIEPQPTIASSSSVILAFAVPLCAILWFSYSWGHYTRVKSFWDETRDLLKMLIYSAVIVVFLLYLQKAHASRLWVGSSYLMLALFCPIARLCAKRILQRLKLLHVPLIVVGHRHRVDSCVEAINSDYSLGYRVAALIDMDSLKLIEDSDEGGAVENCYALINALQMRFPTAHLLLALSDEDSTTNTGRLVDNIVRSFSYVVIARPMHGLSTVNSEILTVEKFDTLFVRLANFNKPVARVYKRLFDISLASMLLLVLSPVLLLVAGISKLDGGSVFYGSARIGKGGRTFKCYKFRSMYEDADDRLKKLIATDREVRNEWLTSFKLKNDPRISKFGQLLRRTSLDELPQLWNVVLGDMSLVGPRPILPDEREQYGDSLVDYERVRPGLTGLWQVSGRSSLSYQKRAQLNLWYLRNWSLWLDFVILLKTVPAVLSSKDAH